MRGPMRMMRNAILATLFVTASLLPLTDANAARVVVRRGPRVTRVTVHPGFPIRRTLPEVVVRGSVVRVAPRVYLAPLAFRATVVALPAPQARVFTASEELSRDDGWTDLTMDVDRRGGGLLLEIDRGAAQISFAEVVFENGETQVVDFNDRVHATGVYSLIDFKDGRKVDHVRVVAKADTRESVLRLHLVS